MTSFDWTRAMAAIAGGGDQVRLSAAAAVEEALQAESGRGRTEWAELAAQLVPVLVAGVGDGHKGVQVRCAAALEVLSRCSDAVLPALREAMAGPDRWRAWGAAVVVARLGTWVPEVPGALGGAMGSADRDVRWAAAGFALQLGRSHPEAVEMVREAARAGSPVARKMAAYCLGAMGAYASVEEDLLFLLADPDRDVRRAAVLAVDKLPGGASSGAGRRVAELRLDPDPFVQRAAAAVAAKAGL